MLTFCIVDDDDVSRRMLENIIEESGLGKVLAMASGGLEGAKVILEHDPDIVLIDLLMADVDGIETIAQLKSQRFQGKFIMISQVVNKDMVGQAYRQGIEFFIQKPINWVEVEAVLQKVSDRCKLYQYITEVKQSLAKLDTVQSETALVRKEKTVRDTVQQILMDLGIIGEVGSKDLIFIMKWIIERKEQEFPPLKVLYESAALSDRENRRAVEKDGKAVEQRLRRTIAAALSNLASLGLMDYCNPKFEYYAPLYFDFQDVRLKMKVMESGAQSDKGKVNIKKFLQVLHMETLSKMNS